MEKKKFNLQGLLLIITIVALISLTIFVINQEKKTIQETEPKIIYVDKDSEKPLENFTKTHAVKALQDTFVAIGKDVDGKERTPEERLKLLENNEEIKIEDIFTEEALSKIHISKAMEEDYFNRTFLSSSLLTYYLVIKEVTGAETFAPLVDSTLLEDAVYFDEEQREVQIPFDVMTGDSRGISFEMVYIDGEWKLNPYSAMMSLVMIVNYENKNSASTEEAE